MTAALRVGLVQMTSGDDPGPNVLAAEALVREAAIGGARFVLTPEVCNVLSASRSHQRAVLVGEAEDAMLGRLAPLAGELGIWLLIGSLALASGDAEGRFVNRSILIGPDGAVRARYDKIHMFDVNLESGESYRESEGFRPGDRAVLAEVEGVPVGLTVCYDLRFPQLFRALAKAGAAILTVPSAFTVPTGRAHWETLLRARAIECGAFVLAPAQVGTHARSTGPERRTWGHSLAVSPWGAILADAGGERPGVTLVDLDLAEVRRARAAVPSLGHDRPFAGPEPVPAAP